MSRRAALPLLLVSLFATNALAWGPAGHRITARLAQDKLSDATEQKVRAILGQRWMSDVANLPDGWWHDNDGARFTQHWHYVNTPISEEAYDAARDCPGDQCVIEQLNDLSAVLSDPNASGEAKKEALIYVIHFVGDIHQPFHNGSGILDGQSDRGGNRINVRFDGGTRNLHSVWDGGLIGKRALSIADWVDYLKDEVLPGLDEAAASGGTPADWSNESHSIGQEQRVENNTTLSDEYVRNAQPIIDDRLAKGALRLAKLIEDALGEN